MRASKSAENSRVAFLVIAGFTIAALYLARVVFVPLALALLFAILLTPAVALLERIKFPRILAVLVIVISLLGILGFLGWKTSRQFVDVVGQLPAYRDTLKEKIHAAKGLQSQNINKASDTVKELEKEIATEAPGSTAAARAPGPLGSSPTRPLIVEQVIPPNPLASVQETLGPLATAAVVTIFTIFIIMGREDLRNRFIRLAGGGRLPVMTQAMDEASSRINRYLFLQLVVNVGYGAIIAGALYLIGIPNASLWGVSAAILRFLPYLGPPLAALMPIVLSLAVFPGWHHALETMGVFLVLELVVSNFVEPLLYGTHVGLSALAILVAAVFWALIWGFPGLLLSTPLTVCLVVMGRYVPSLAFFSVLLGDEPVMSPAAQYYQRLLASDQSEARKILDEYRKEKSLEDLYSSVIIPALILAEQDRHENELDDDTQNFIYQTTREFVEELGAEFSKQRSESKSEGAAEASAGEPETSSGLRVTCIPARDDADDVVAMMLSQLLELAGHRSQGLRIGMTSEMLAEIKNAKPNLVCISALPPFAVDHARTLYTKLRAESPDLQIDICLWNFEGDPVATATRLRLGTGHRIYTTLEQVLRDVEFKKENIAPSS